MTNTSKSKKNLKKTYGENNIYIYIYRFIKRLFDIVAGIVGIIILIPLTIVIYVIRKFLKEDDGPIFYTQLRIGKNGKYFKLYKYRTMVIGADRILKKYLKENENAKTEYTRFKKLKDDPRITRLGKILRRTSIDEMPQFINVLKGEMSLIGPRPYLLAEQEEMGKYYKDIIRCKPGITGLWQVSGRNGVEFKERLKIDKDYIDNYSLKLDFEILIKTIGKVLKKEGAV